jgi:hypothetical protein
VLWTVKPVKKRIRRTSRLWTGCFQEVMQTAAVGVLMLVPDRLKLADGRRITRKFYLTIVRHPNNHVQTARGIRTVSVTNGCCVQTRLDTPMHYG